MKNNLRLNNRRTRIFWRRNNAARKKIALTDYDFAFDAEKRARDERV